MNFNKFFKVAITFAVIGIFISMIGIVTRGQYIRFVGWLVFYMPFMWVVWLICLLIADVKKYFLRLIGLWFAIDISVLLLYISFSLKVENWHHARGLEVLAGVTYLPVIFPTGFLIYLVPANADLISNRIDNVIIDILGPVVGGPFCIWLWMSIIAAMQSLGLMGCVYAWQVRKGR